MNILVFTKSGCPPCSALKPIISEFENVTFLDAVENMDKYRLRQAPTTVFIKEGKEVSRFIGVRSKEEIEQILQSLM